MARKIIIGIVIFLIVIQFIPATKNISTAENPDALKKHYVMPDTIGAILQSACYDCHTNNTRYPWYDKIQPVSWWLAYHVKDGKKHLNFDAFATYPLKKQEHKLEELVESQTDGWMPLSSYALIHTDAKLTDAQKKLVIDWANGLRSEIKAKMAAGK
ncbi:MAG: heme-binding domain-containing protein [Sphingobacteriaceae bacterium]